MTRRRRKRSNLVVHLSRFIHLSEAATAPSTTASHLVLALSLLPKLGRLRQFAMSFLRRSLSTSLPKSILVSTFLCPVLSFPAATFCPFAHTRLVSFSLECFLLILPLKPHGLRTRITCRRT